MESFNLELAGKTLTIETGEVAKQADGAVMVRYGDTVLLVTSTVSDEPRDVDFLPLTVDYEERLYAVGRIPGGFIKREGRPTEKATLAARLTDRPLRPLFPKGMRNGLHIVTTVLSVDQDCPPEPLSILGASAALSISKIPFEGPVSAVQVGLVDGEPVVNPTVEQMENSKLDLVVAGTEEAIMMVEAGAQEISEEMMLESLEKGHEEIKKACRFQKEIQEKVGEPKMEVLEKEEYLSEETRQAVENEIAEKIKEALRIEEKQEREEKLDSIKKEVIERYLEEYPESENELKQIFEATLRENLRSMVLKEKIRADGRKPEEIRDVSCKVGILPRTHGSSLFTRGQTQVLNVCTLGAQRDVQILDGLGIEEFKRFIHHYNFPPYSVGETGFMRGPGRREIGHGALAERALEPLIPDNETFPYTLRLVSEVVESNGSTSMGSVCAGSLSLMDAGVPIPRPVSGIAMGMIKEEEDYEILSDIQGIEDFLGDMDFKVAGTENGITALQMDIKVKGLSREIMEQAIDRARKGYLFIMEKMNEAISAPREELSPYAPRIITMQIDPEKIRDVIGPGGKMVNKITAETGVEVNIDPDGKLSIASPDEEAGKKAQEIIEDLIRDVETGKTYLGKITRVEKYGAFAEVMPGKEGLIHISHLDHQHVGKTEDVVNVGDEVMVKVIGIDDRGRINLSRKEAMERPADKGPPDKGGSPDKRGGPPNKDKNKDRDKSNTRKKT